MEEIRWVMMSWEVENDWKTIWLNMIENGGSIAGMGFDQRLQCYLPLLRLQMWSCGQTYRTSVLPGAPSQFNSLVGLIRRNMKVWGWQLTMAFVIHLEFFCWSLNKCNIGNKFDTQHDSQRCQFGSLDHDGPWRLLRSSFIASLQWLAGRWNLWGALKQSGP